MVQLYIAFPPPDVTVKFEPVLYHVVESSMAAVVRLVLEGDTSNTVAVTVSTLDQDAMCRLPLHLLSSVCPEFTSLHHQICRSSLQHTSITLILQ